MDILGGILRYCMGKDLHNSQLCVAYTKDTDSLLRYYNLQYVYCCVALYEVLVIRAHVS